MPNPKEIYFTKPMYKTLLKLSLLIPYTLIGQIENQVRDDNPGLFKNQRLFHSPPKPLFKYFFANSKRTNINSQKIRKRFSFF